MTVVGVVFFLIGSGFFLVRSFTDFFREDEGRVEETASVSAALFIFFVMNVLKSPAAAVACFLALSFNFYVAWRQLARPWSGVIKRHEIEHIFSKRDVMEVSEYPTLTFSIEKTESGMCEVSYNPTQDDIEFACCASNADDYEIFKEFGMGRWQYMTSDWLYRASYLYRFFTYIREQVSAWRV